MSMIRIKREDSPASELVIRSLPIIGKILDLGFKHEPSEADGDQFDFDSDGGDEEGKAIRAEIERARHGDEHPPAEDAEYRPKNPHLKSHGSRNTSPKRRHNDSDDDKETESDFVPSEDESSESEYEPNKKSSPKKPKPISKLESNEPRQRRLNVPNAASRPAFRPNNSHLPKFLRDDDADDEEESDTGIVVGGDHSGDDDDEPWVTNPTNYFGDLASEPSVHENTLDCPVSESDDDESGMPLLEVKFESMASRKIRVKQEAEASDSDDSLSSFDRRYGSTKSPSPARASQARRDVKMKTKKAGEVGSEVDDSDLEWFDEQFPSIKAAKKMSPGTVQQAKIEGAMVREARF